MLLNSLNIVGSILCPVDSDANCEIAFLYISSLIGVPFPSVSSVLAISTVSGILIYPGRLTP